MQVFFFHLMPYGALDLAYAKSQPSSWVTLPNSQYDPKIGHQLYNRYLDELELADKLGFDGVCVNEHHQTAYGLMPAPNVLAGALSRRTERAKIAILGRALPLIDNPLSIAEEYAILDNITGGRIVTGFVRGIGCEYHVSRANPVLSNPRFQEAHDLIVRAWTETGPFSWEGRYYNFDYVNIWPRPFQQPHPPIWIPSQGSRSTIEWTSHPDRKYPYLQTFSPISALKRYLTEYRETADAYGYEASGDQLGWAVPVYVADTDEQARAEAKAHIEAFYNIFLRMPLEYLLPPGYTSMESMRGMAAKFKAKGDDATIDELMELGMILCGSPATVRETIAHYQKELGFNLLVAMGQFGTLPADLTRRSMEMFAADVLPALKGADTPHAAAVAS